MYHDYNFQKKKLLHFACIHAKVTDAHLRLFVKAKVPKVSLLHVLFSSDAKKIFLPFGFVCISLRKSFLPTKAKMTVLINPTHAHK